MVLSWLFLVAAATAPSKPAACPPPAAVVASPDKGPDLSAWSDEAVGLLYATGVAMLNGEGDGGNGTRFVKALVLFEKDADTVISMLSKTHRQVEYLSQLQKAETLKKSTTGNLERHTVKSGWFSVVYHMRHKWDVAGKRLWWCLDGQQKNDLRAAEGYWRIHPLEKGRSIGEYATHIDVGAAVPDFLQNYFARKDVPKALHAQRQWIDSNGTYRKDD